MVEIENKGKTILLIEDDPLLVKMYNTKFQKEGYGVIFAEDGEDGLKKALAGGYQILLLDVMMPKLSGFDLLTRLRQDPVGKEIPVIMLTNLTQEEEMNKAKALGVKEYLIKSNLTPSQVVEKVRKYIG